MSPAPLFEATGLTKHFGGLKALQGLSMRIERGEIVALIGPNGAGKTTCFNLITAADVPTSGQISLDGESLEGLPAWRVAQRGIGRTFQNIRLFKEMTVLDNVRTTGGFRARYGLLSAVLRGPRFREEEAALRESAMRLLARGSTPPRRAGRRSSATATSGGSRSRGPSRSRPGSCSSTSLRRG
jgi:branched-chain amino acid transport system ATP-binding protein